MANKGYQGSAQCFAAGGPVLNTSDSQFFKTPDQFRTDTGVKQDYASKGGNKPKGKSLPAVKPKS